MNRVLALALLLLMAITVQAAPAPFARLPKRQPVRLPQTCIMHYQGTPFQTVFRPDGSYEAVHQQHGTHWVGTWRLDHDREGCTWLTVREALQPDGCVISWTYAMQSCLRKSVNHGQLQLVEQ